MADIARVLRPGGRFYFFEPTRKTLARWPANMLFDQPDHGMFTGDEFVAGVEKAGMMVGDRRKQVVAGVWIAGAGVKN